MRDPDITIYQYLLIAEDDADIDAAALRSLNDWVVKLLLMPVSGVTDVLSFGGEVRQYQVNVDPIRLLAFDLELSAVIEAFEANNRNAGGWYLQHGAEQLVIRGTGWVAGGTEGLEDIASIPLKTVDGTTVRVGDVAHVAFGSEIRQGAVTMTRRSPDGQPQALGEVVAGIVLKRAGANTSETIDALQARVERVRQTLPDGVRLEVFYDQSDLVDKAVRTVTDALLQAFVFIIIVLAVFLMNLRATLLVLISVPLSIGLALMVMTLTGQSANLMSLGGLAVAIGMLVDGSVVVIDNLFRHANDPHTDGDMPVLIKRATMEVARPVFFATLIILVVFMPLFSFEGVEARLFKPMVISIMLALTAALVTALLIVPALAAMLFRVRTARRENRLLVALETRYRQLLGRAMQTHRSIVAGTGGLLLLALASVPFLGTEFAPTLEEGTLVLRVTLAPSASLDTALEVSQKVEGMLLEFPEVTYALSRIGRPELGGDPEPVNNIEIYIGLKPHEQWTSARNRPALQSQMLDRLATHPGLLFNFSQPIAIRVDELLAGVKAQLAIKLFGPDLTVLQRQGELLTALVSEIPGTQDVQLEPIAGETQLIIAPDRRALARYGLSVDQIMRLVSQGLGGAAAGQVISGNERYDIQVRLAETARSDLHTIANLRLRSDSGAWVRLADVASVELASAPPQISREDVQRRIVIQANVSGRDMGSVVSDIRHAIEQNRSLPPGYHIAIGGQFESQQRAQQRLMLAVPVSVILIALLLYFAFGSLRQTLLIMLNVPLALIGGLLALAISGQYLSVPSSIGFITLFGIAVLNGVVMVSAINQRIADGQPLDTAVVDGAVTRLRPVLMTALTSMLGLLPLLLASGIGSEVQRPLATVIVGGLISATALTLLVLPCLYPLFTQRAAPSANRAW